jgi:hypothetical protein
LWWLVGVFPSVIAIEAPHPLRMIAAIPATAALVGLGLEFVTVRLAQRFTRRRTLVYALPILIILLPVPAMVQAYFVGWTDSQETRGVYDYGAVAIRDTVLANAGPDTPIYLPMARFNDSTLLYYMSGTFAREATTNVLPTQDALVVAPDRNIEDAVWVRLIGGKAQIVPPLNAAGQQIIQSGLMAETSRPVVTANGETIANIAPLPADPALYVQGVTELFDVSFGAMRLTGANYDPGLVENQPIPVTLFWEADRTMRTEYEVLVRLVSDNRQSMGNGDARPNDWVYPTSFWRPGIDRIAARHQVKIDQDLLPGRYWLAVSVFDGATGQRLPLTADNTGDSPDTFFIGPLKVPIPWSPEELPSTNPAVNFDNIAALTGYDIDIEPVVAGDTVQLPLVWQSLTETGTDYTVFVHLLDESNRLVAGSDGQPLDGTYPTTIWTPGEYIIDTHRLPIPGETAAGEYRLAVGLYNHQTGERLKITLPNGTAAPSDQFVLPAQVTVSTR